jgi:hypothetical protein
MIGVIISPITASAKPTTSSSNTPAVMENRYGAA